MNIHDGWRYGLYKFNIMLDYKTDKIYDTLIFKKLRALHIFIIINIFAILEKHSQYNLEWFLVDNAPGHKYYHIEWSKKQKQEIYLDDSDSWGHNNKITIMPTTDKTSLTVTIGNTIITIYTSMTDQEIAQYIDKAISKY